MISHIKVHLTGVFVGLQYKNVKLTLITVNFSVIEIKEIEYAITGILLPYMRPSEYLTLTFKRIIT